MPRPKLSSLSSLLPAKGEAVRPEPVTQLTELDRKHKRQHEGLLAANQSSKKEAASDPLNAYKEGPRGSVSFRMTESLQERLRLHAFEARRSKQDVLDDALHEYLVRLGY